MKKDKEIAQLVRPPARRTQVLKVLGFNSAAVYWLLGLCATGVLQHTSKYWKQAGAVIVATNSLPGPQARQLTNLHKTAWGKDCFLRHMCIYINYTIF